MATDNPNRRIDDKLPGQPLRWDDAQGAGNEEPLDPQLQRIVDAFMPEADGDDDAELRAGGPKRLLAFDYFKRGYLAREQSSTAGAARQGGITKEAFEQIVESWDGCSYDMIDDIGAALRRDFERLGASIPPSTAPAPQTDELTTLRAQVEQLQAMLEDRVSRKPNDEQEWASHDGAIAFHLIERHADNWNDAGNMMESWAQARAKAAQAAPSAPTDDVLSLHRQLAAEKLRADQGWERADAKSKECIELRERMAASKAAPSAKAEPVGEVKRGTYGKLIDWRPALIDLPVGTKIYTAAPAPAVLAEDVRNLALEEAAEKLEAMNDSSGDAAAYDQREQNIYELEREHAISDCVKTIRSLKSDAAPSTSQTSEGADHE